MNNQWVKILVFGLLFGIGGYLIGRTCGRGCVDRGGCHGEMSCRGDHHGKGQGHHDKKACCADGHDAGGHGEGHDDRVHAIIHGLKDANFQGDTTINGDGCTVTVSRHGDKMEVKVEMSDSMKVEEKTVEVH
jgi:hypothetical protein